MPSPNRVYLTPFSAGYAAIDAICDYYTTLQSRTVKPDVQPGYLIKTLPSEFSCMTSGQLIAAVEPCGGLR